MSREIKAIVGSLDNMVADSLAAAKELDAGKEAAVREAIYFSSTQDMLRVLSPKRMVMLQELREAGAMSVRALAQLLGRDYKNVHTDVKELEKRGLIERDVQNRIVAPYDVIHADFDLRKAA